MSPFLYKEDESFHIVWRLIMILEKCVIGIEFGSTNIKAVMLDENHEIIASNDYAWESTLKNGIWIYTLEQDKIGLAD